MHDSYHWNCANLPQHPLPPQISWLTSHHHHGPAAEDLLVLEEWVPQGCTGCHGYCDYHVGKQIPKLLLVDMVLLGTRWWSLNTLFQTGKRAMGNIDFSTSILLFPRYCITFKFSSHLHSLLCAIPFVYVSGAITHLREFLKGDDSIKLTL